MKIFDKLFRYKSQPQTVNSNRPVVVVSGLPRSGTSMMMKMLEAGGIEILSDDLRQADEDNPKGYYEFERVKQLDKGDDAWVANASGKAVKVISALLEYLPSGYYYRVIFMNRRIEEVIASQRKMLKHRGEESNISDEELAELLRRHVIKVKSWVNSKPNFVLLDVDYNAIVVDPVLYVHRINSFLGGGLDEDAMVAAVDPNLYRNRTTKRSDR